ncbi:MAG TPA: hypothetical protein VNM48_00150 [Chloroflexota bacterium]|nr:hypothetical protein [Chloroflexota bacterium]
MPTRLLREGILSSERVARLGWLEEVFYRRLMSVVDDYGRFYAHPSLLRAACYPLQLDKVSDSDVGKWLRVTEKAALVRVYPAPDGKRYLELLDFGQRIQSKSRFPDPTESTVIHGESPESTVIHRLVGVEDVDEGDIEASPLVVVPTPPPCPHDQIVALYHELLPANPRLKVWTGARKASLQARWREDAKRQSLDYWRRFLTHAAASPFLTGRVEGKAGRPFLPGLDWMVKADNFAKIIEGRFHDRQAA